MHEMKNDGSNNQLRYFKCAQRHIYLAGSRGCVHFTPFSWKPLKFSDLHHPSGNVKA